MPIATHTFRVFVSSTFEDLKEERNALAAPGGPFAELTKICQTLGASFQAIDLRWGVREEAGHDQRTMEICLGEIERCQRTGIKPNFIVLLGDRYGWRPLPARIEADEFRAVRERIAGAEDRELVDGWYQLDENAVPPEYLLKPRAGEFIDKELWGAIEATMRGAQREAARAAGLSGDSLVKYEASATHQETLKGLDKTAEDRAHVFAFFRTPQGPDHDPAMAALKQLLRDQLKSNVFEPRDTNELCERVRESLERVIRAEAKTFQSRPELDLELEAHDAFGRDRARHFMGREAVLRAVDEYLLGGEDRRPMVVCGASGSGKSAVMARASEGALADSGKAVVVRRFIGATPDSSDGLTLLRGLCEEIGQVYGVAEEIPADFNSVVRTFANRLTLATTERPLVVFMDALDQIAASDPAAKVTWLMPELPEHCRVVVSTTDISGAIERARMIELAALPMEDAEGALALWLHGAGRELRDWQREKMLTFFRRCGLPLYLKLAFEEARRWRSFDAPEGCLLGEGIAGIIDMLFDRLSSSAEHGRALVSHSLGYLAAARYGLTGDEMLDILTEDEDVWTEFDSAKHHDPPEMRLPTIVWSRFYLDIEPYLMELAVPGGTVATFYHRQLPERIAARFLAGDQARVRHRALSRYFGRQPHWLAEERGQPNARKAVELVYQQLCAGLTDEATSTLTDLDFVAAKCAAGLVSDLQEDYGKTIDLLPEAQADLAEERRRELAEKHTRDLIACAKGEIRRLEVPASVPIPSEEQASANVLRIRDNPTRPDQLRAFAGFVSSESYPLGKLAAHPGFVLQHAFNSAPSGPVHLAADRQVAKSTSALLLRTWPEGAQYTPKPNPFVTLQGHKGSVKCLCVTPDGRLALSGGTDKMLRVWDLNAGVCLRTIDGGTDEVTGVGVTADGRRAVSGGRDALLRVWDLGTGACLRIMEGHTSGITSVSLTPDGRRAVSGSMLDASLRAWDLQTGTCLHALPGGAVQGVGITPDGRRAVSASMEYRLRVWDLEAGACLRTFLCGSFGTCVGVTMDGTRAVSMSTQQFWMSLGVWDLREHGADPSDLHGESTSSLSVTPDGLRMLAGNGDGTLWLSDLRTGACLRTMEGHAKQVSSICVTPDGRRAVSGSSDKTLRLWDLASGKCLGILEGHTDQVEAVILTPDGRQAVSWSKDKTLRVWDLATSTCLRTLTGLSESVGRMTTDGRWVVAACPNKTLLLLDLETGDCLHRLEGRDTGIYTVTWTPDGRWTVLGGSEEPLRAWTRDIGMRLSVLDGNLPSNVESVTRDGRRAISMNTSKELGGIRHCSICVWNLETRACEVTVALPFWANKVAISEPLGRLVVGTPTGQVAIYRTWGFEWGLAGRSPQPEELEGQLRREVASCTQVWGTSHANTLRAQFTLAEFLSEAGQKTESQSIYRDISNRHEKLTKLEKVEILRRLIPRLESSPDNGHLSSVKEQPTREWLASTAHPAANPDREMRLNLEYQKARRAWEALPLWKRLMTKRPVSPSGF